MPVLVERRRRGSQSRSFGRSRRVEARFREDAADCLDIALVNNMPDAALEATERQFFSLLEAGAGDMQVRLHLTSLPHLPRSEYGRRHIAAHYVAIDELWRMRLDGLIVTGTEPRESDLRAEPYWEVLTEVFDWAERNTMSTVCSCLAAHAALLHFDGIHRAPLSEKRFGVYAFSRASDHPVLAGAPSRLSIPHSRWNDIAEKALMACDYSILTRSPEIGADSFARERNSLFLFFQGHPEYDAWSLMLEYRRDIGRYLKGERDTYPGMPQGYFDEETMALLRAFQESAMADRREATLASFPTAAAVARLRNTWRTAAHGVYRNWLAYVSARKARALEGRTRVTPAQFPPIAGSR